MHLSKAIKVLIGIATFLVVITPLLFIGLWFAAFFFTFSGASEEPPFAFFGLFTLMFPMIFILTFLQLGLLVFYIVHIIKNAEGADTIRIILGIGLYLLPYISYPAYYLIYVWPENPPAWALKSQSLANIPAVQGANLV